MKKFFIIIGLVGILFVGCSQETDETAIETLITDVYSDLFSIEDDYQKPEGDSVTPSQKKDYAFVFWWRELQDVSRNINISIEGDSAFVTINKELSGIMHRYPTDTWPPEDSILIDIPKDFQDNALRYVVLKRDGNPRIHRGWRIVAVSGAKILSPTRPFQIDSVKIVSADSSLIYTVKDPLELVNIDSIMKIERLGEATISVYTSPESVKVCVFVHTRGYMRVHRYRIMEKAPGVYCGRWLASPMEGRRRLGIDVLTYETIFNDSTGYEGEGWIIPYESTGE